MYSFQLPVNIAIFLGLLPAPLCKTGHSLCSPNTANRCSYLAHQKVCRQEESEGEEAAAAAGEEMSC